jgi:hypothetical protein
MITDDFVKSKRDEQYLSERAYGDQEGKTNKQTNKSGRALDMGGLKT